MEECNLYAIKFERFINIEHLKEFYEKLDHSGQLKFIIGNLNSNCNVILIRTALDKEKLERVMGVKVIMWVNNDIYVKMSKNEELVKLFCKLIDNL